MNILRRLFLDPETSKVRPFWRGQLFLFDRPPAPTFSSREDLKLLLVFLFLEGIARRALDGGARWVGITGRDWWPLAQMIFLTSVVCWLVIGFARVRLSQLGLSSWLRWSRTEKFYLLQIVPIAIGVFSFAQSASLRTLWSRPHLEKIGLFILVPKMIWGFYQEFLYRGILQTALVRRWGALPGILASNLIFTFGPLHAYHFRAAARHPSHLWIFAAIFAIGLLFAIIFERSGNLWIIAIMHGVGDWFMDGVAQVSRMAP
jgi:membrane protease YdiL (CAAX protease family)